MIMKKIVQKNKVTAEESEILNILAEECSESVQAITKIFRFGWSSCHPDKPNWTNKEHLTEELGDLIAMIGILVKKDILSGADIQYAAEMKLEKLRKYSNIDLK